MTMGTSPDYTEHNADVAVLQTNFQYLSVLGLWPAAGKGFSSKTYLLRLFIFATLSIATASCVFIDTYYIFDKRDLFIIELLTDIATTAAFMNMLFIETAFLLKRRSIFKFVQALSDFGTFTEPYDMDEGNRRVNRIATFTVLYTLADGLAHQIFALTDGEKCKQKHIENNMERMCHYIFAFPTHYLPAFFKNYSFILFGVQLIGAFELVLTAFLIIICTCGIIDLLTRHIHQLKRHLNEAFDPKNELERKNRLKYCVRYHVHIINLTHEMNAVFGNITFVNTTFTAIVLAVLIVQAMVQPEPKAIIHALAWVFLLFSICYTGQQLIDESEEIPQYIYNTDWFTGDVDSQKYLLMVIAVSNNHLYLDAKGFGEVGLLTFSAAMQTCYSVITLLYSQD